jgi:hypothetical protein
MKSLFALKKKYIEQCDYQIQRYNKKQALPGFLFYDISKKKQVKNKFETREQVIKQQGMMACL